MNPTLDHPLFPRNLLLIVVRLGSVIILVREEPGSLVAQWFLLLPGPSPTLVFDKR